MMDDILKIIIDFCQEYDMLPRSGRVLACVSGGADSMCLLHILNSIAPEYGFDVSAAHFNHMLRGDESDGDESFVREYCERLAVPLYVGCGNVAAEAARRKAGIEETAREMRYAFFHETAKTLGDARIATAHSADDNLETVLLRIARGTGLAGLCGIPPVRGDIIRPLLSVTRADIEKYNSENGIPYREDSSNLSDDYARNKLRHHVIPVIKELNPSAAAAVSQMTGLLRKDEDYLATQASAFVDKELAGGALSASKLSALPFPLASRVVRLVFGGGLSSGHVTAVLDLAKSANPSAKLSLPGLTIRREYDKLISDAAENITFRQRLLPLDSSIIIDELGLKFSCEKIDECGVIHKSLTTFFLKCDNITEGLLIRPRIEGDKIRLSQKSGLKSLKKLFIDKKIPAIRRTAVPVICDGLGPAAIPGIGCDERMYPAPGEPAIKITVEEIQKND